MRALFDSAAALCRRRSWSPPLVWLGATEGRCVGRCVECAPGPGSKMGGRGIWDGTATGKRVGPHHGHLGRGGRVAPTVGTLPRGGGRVGRGGPRGGLGARDADQLVLVLLGGAQGREGRRHLGQRVRRFLRGRVLHGAPWLLCSLALGGFRGGLKHATHLFPGDRGRWSVGATRLWRCVARG